VPLRRIQIEEIGVEEDKATTSFRKKTEAEPLPVDKPDLFSVHSGTRPCDPPQIAASDELPKLKKDEVISRSSGQGDKRCNIDATKPSCSSVATKSGLPVPTSSFQFQADWKILKHAKESFYQYFKVSHGFSC
jgi:hypothetical protein